MRDAMGGTVVIVIIVVFIVFALGYMSFNVNYTKAFRMKDKIISVYDDYNGVCGSKCEQEIREYAKQLGYSSGAGTGGVITCPGGNYSPKTNLYCVKEMPATTTSDGRKRKYYSIVTRISMEIPVFKDVLNFNFFYVYGDTKTYKY